ncbi:GntR family transcriptional regulator [Actinobacteria bacterium YIM 96077]|uniref:GntR family transcriptional regulator n=1 Tax=Phytoactinopolyspora halophila TaxID=1981511 RepID=A0A329QUY5_9ACTN|nr:GntR family transcriptional regulator [Actinobacteria bacterium YIM 96077]RAW15409.1 GntR family transcriptional regulator [Phytoactinopolyspora halophila]
MTELDPDLPVTLWRQLANVLRAQIEAGELQGLIPSEPTLCQRYGVSRATVRTAKASLIEEDLLTVVKGRGTFVKSSRE